MTTLPALKIGDVGKQGGVSIPALSYDKALD